MSCFIGIDPGASGGVAVITATGIVTLSLKMGMGKVLDLLIGLGGLPCYAVMEKVTGYIPRPERQGYAHEGQTGHAMFNFGKSVGRLEGLLLGFGLVPEEVVPRVWQKRLGIAPRDKTRETPSEFKSRLKAIAQGLYPSKKVTLETCDAILLARYCQLKFSGML